MHEHIARVLYYCGVHLLYASIVWLGAWVLTSIPWGSATVKYWIWFATSLNFIAPAGAILDRLFASHLSWARPLSFIGGVGLEIAENTTAASALAAIWLFGAGLMAVRLYLRLWNERHDLRATHTDDRKQGFFAHGVPVTFGGTCRGPAVEGILRPHISLPSGIDRLLSETELNAVLIHEATHARRRDNLIRLVHEAGLCLLWFHPLVWITGFRLALYRELSCDESVIRSAHGGDLVSALAKLANPQDAFLLRASASSFLGRRLVRLAAASPQHRLASVLLTVVFGVALAGGVWGTVAHTACCFLLRK
jgi:beta-lactamase regulating signal transducer with metallopeptidase domain